MTDTEMVNPLVSADELRIIFDAVVRLTEIRRRGCAHLCVENFADEMLRNLLKELAAHKGKA